MNLSKGLKQFLSKTFLFLVIFIIVSGIIGSWVISTRLLFDFKFNFYGGLGKLVLFSSIAFIIFAKKEITKIKEFEYKRSSLLYFIPTILLVFLFFQSAKTLLNYPSFTSNLSLSIFAHLSIISIPIFIALAIFGSDFVVYFTQKFKRELCLCITISVIFYIAMFYIWKFWYVLSFFVVKIVYFLLSLSFHDADIIAPRTLVVGEFSLSIEQACSGIYSIFLFTSLYILITFLDWKVLNKKKILILFLPATIGLFFVNCLRIYLLMLIGILISPQLALALFHTYASMIFFVIYFGIFWLLLYKWMKR